MTEIQWAEYIQTYKPTDKESLTGYLKDLYNYARQGNLESGISMTRANQLIVDFPEVKDMSLYKMIDNINRSHQYNVQEGFRK